MKILEEVIEKMHDTLEEVEFYGTEAHHLRNDHRILADKYAKIAEMHITIYSMLHESVVMLIEEEKKKGIVVPKEMEVIWDYEHKKLIQRFNEAKYVVDEYKKLSY